MVSLTRKLRRENKSIGLVPTMGALHAGHLSLVKQARQSSDIVIVSIFVNPSQFNDDRDLQAYPRDLPSDAAMLAQYDVDYIFAPDASEIYGKGFSTHVYVDDLGDTLEGASRPGHFRGVATIITILFIATRPDFAFFGQKDAQQITVIRRLARDLGFDTEIVVMPTLREESGLAMSSRNERLSQDERIRAAVLFRALNEAEASFKGGERKASKLTEIVQRTIAQEPQATIDHIAVIDSATLRPIEKIGDTEALIALAATFGDVRLIDNVVLNRRQ